MKDLQKIGGYAALAAAVTFVVGFVLLIAKLSPIADPDLDPDRSVAFRVDNEAVIYVWHTIIYVVFGVVLVVSALAIHERLRAVSVIVPIATAFGLIWAGLVLASGMVANIGLGTVVELSRDDPERAASVWLAIDSVQNGLGGGNEIVGGLWVLLVSWAGLTAGGLPRTLNYLGVVAGVAGIVTVVPSLEIVGAIFGLGLIVWFAWLGVVMVRDNAIAPEVQRP